MSRRAPLGQAVGDEQPPCRGVPTGLELPLPGGVCSRGAFRAPETHAGCPCPHLLPSLCRGGSPAPPPPGWGKASITREMPGELGTLQIFPDVSIRPSLAGCEPPESRF